MFLLILTGTAPTTPPFLKDISVKEVKELSMPDTPTGPAYSKGRHTDHPKVSHSFNTL